MTAKPLAPGKSFEIAFHAWRGIGPDVEPDLYFWRRRFGFVTVMTCRVCVLTAYQSAKARAAKLRVAIVGGIDMAEGRK